MTIKHMRIFKIVYQKMNITRAAKLLHMTQPAVTRSIQELEKYYGVCLFERINHRLFCTESGNELYSRALHIIESFDDLEKGIKNWDEFGILRIGGSITIGNFIFPDVISSFQKLHPNLQIKVTISNSTNIQQAILNNKIDLGLIEENASAEYMTSQLLAEDHLCLILPLNHPLLDTPKIYLKDLIKYPLLLRENGSAGRTFLNHTFAFHGIDFKPMWESSSTQALVKAVSNGLGISILPEKLVLQDIASNIVVSRHIEDESFIRKNYIIWHRQKFLTHTAKDFICLCHSFSSQA